MKLWLRATGVLLLGIVAIGGTSAYGQITNPSFEDGTGTDLSGITGWTTSVAGSGLAGSVAPGARPGEPTPRTRST